MATTQPASATDAPAADAPASSGKLSFIPLEANPDLMTKLLHRLGLAPALQMHDVLSLSDPDLLGFVPRPALALLLVFPVSAAYESHRLAEDASVFGGEADPTHGDKHDAAAQAQRLLQLQTPPGITWFPQTIRNACGMMALLHAAANGGARGFVADDSALGRLLKQAAESTPEERARLVETSADLARAHEAAASAGDSAAPDARSDVDLHYVCFVKGPGGEAEGGGDALWELDGRRKGPLNRGPLDAREDVLSERALAEGPLKFLAREGADLRFSCVALAGALD